MKLMPLAALSDNDIWLLQGGHKALVVDPGDAQPVLDYLQAHAAQLDGILITHHHTDHTGGVDPLRDSTVATVFGPASEVMPEPLQRLRGGDLVNLLGLHFRVLDVPGHTAGHIAYVCENVDSAPQLQCPALCAAGQPTLPSSIGVERAINPFLRSDTPAVIASVTRFDAQGVHSDGIFATLRRWKNQSP